MIDAIVIAQSHNLKYFRIDNLSRIVKSTLKANALVALDTILSNINEEDLMIVLKLFPVVASPEILEILEPYQRG